MWDHKQLSELEIRASAGGFADLLLRKKNPIAINVNNAFLDRIQSVHTVGPNRASQIKGSPHSSNYFSASVHFLMSIAIVQSTTMKIVVDCGQISGKTARLKCEGLGFGVLLLVVLMLL